MNDPERLLHGSPGGLSARLLRAGVDETPAPRSLERTLVALGAASTTLGAAGTAVALGASSATGGLGAVSAGKAITTLTLVSLAKWAGLGVAGGVAVSLAAQVVERAPAAPPVEPPALVGTGNAAAELEPPRVVPLPELPGPAPTASLAVEPRLAPLPAPSHGTDAPAGAPLAAEVTFVDRGRSLFQHGDAKGALAALAPYERTFREQRLLPEVLYLRMEALALAGDKARATEVARRLVRDYGKGPHAARARTFL